MKISGGKSCKNQNINVQYESFPIFFINKLCVTTANGLDSTGQYRTVHKFNCNGLTLPMNKTLVVRKVCPQYEMDGVLNLWIIKPGSSSRGRGISITNKLERILSKSLESAD